MYKILIKNIEKKYDYAELIKIFLRPDEFELYTEEELDEMTQGEPSVTGKTNPADTSADSGDIDSEDIPLVFNESCSEDKNGIKREIYSKLAELKERKPEWGILTGVRPVKLTGEIFERVRAEFSENGESTEYNSSEKAEKYDKSLCISEKVKATVRNELKNTYLLNDEKIELLIDTYSYQQEVCGKAEKNSVGVYIGIPFCPTRCVYCSFTSNQVGDAEIARYLEALKKEIAFVGKRMKETGLFAESIYIGGGTPTTLTAEQLDDLLNIVELNMDLTAVREFTVEAGRPDTITEDKLEVLKRHRIERISINPQSMKAETLRLIGRSHEPKDIVSAFGMADKVGIAAVNADVIAGLPEETAEDFAATLDSILALKPENITVHTLAVKRASKLVEVDKDFHYRQGETVSAMLKIAKEKLKAADFRPYYLYRQKHMAGSFENVGYCKGDTPSIYNIRIMEEKQTILALGAGGISKMYYPEENRLERVPNVSNYEIYISRLEEMLNRKEENIFKEVK